jgi:glycine/D-amino acid oxidase-like deaminating enzyme
MGNTSDALPHIGEVPEKKGQFIAAGFNGHGMPNIFLATKGIAKMINEKVPFEQCGIPRVYKTTKERLESKKDVYAAK